MGRRIWRKPRSGRSSATTSGSRSSALGAKPSMPPCGAWAPTSRSSLPPAIDRARCARRNGDVRDAPGCDAADVDKGYHSTAMTVPAVAGEGAMSADDFDVLRRHMLAEIAAGALHVSNVIGKPMLDKRVMAAMARVARHEFVPIELQAYAYANIPLPIGFDKTVSQPFIVALMTDLLDIGPGDSVLEIGTGLGYHAAVLAQLAAKVYSIEIVEELARQAKQRLQRQGCSNVELRIGNGYHGWSEHAPFDKVLVAAAPDLIPPPLLQQLKAGGKMVVPAGLPDAQQLMFVEKNGSGRVTMREILPVRFSQLEEP